MAEDNEMLTEEQVAAMLGISYKQAKRLRLSGQGPRFIRISPRVVRYARRDVVAWMERGGAEEP